MKNGGNGNGKRLHELQRHAETLAKSNKKLENEVARRRAGEVIIKQGREHYEKLFIESQVMQKQLRHLTHQVILAQEEERREISRELHDGVVQTLVGINVALSTLADGAAISAGTLRPRINRTKRLVEKAVLAVHRFARELRPPVLDDLGVIPALHDYCKKLAERKDLKIRLTVCRGVEALSPARRIVLFRVSQEALTNVLRHAKASAVRIRIREIPGHIRMEISDNGTAFEVGKVMGNGNPSRLGLIGMKERIEMVGGTLVIESTPGIGTTVRADFPHSQDKKTS